MPRNTAPGSNPSTNVAVTADVTSTVARHGIHGGVTVANRVALHNGILPIKNVGRGVLTTGHTNVASVIVYGRGGGGVLSVPRGCLGNMRFRCMRSMTSI